MTYREALVEAMKTLSMQDNVLFIGQSVLWPGHAIYTTLQDAGVPLNKRIELPVAEDMQLGISQGLALAGYLPVSIFPRIDFLLCAANQLVNHLDKWAEMSHGEWNPKVIIRTMVGGKEPLNPGPQHCQDHTDALRMLCPNINVYCLNNADKVVSGYNEALASGKSSILIEYGGLYA